MDHKVLCTLDGDVHYFIEKSPYKNAKCLVFTHGVTANHTMFEKQVEVFRNKHTILTWDVPEHGLSMPFMNFSFTKTAYVLRNILKKEGIKKVVLIGMSMGGYVSQMFGYIYPEMVEGFVSLGSTPFGPQFYSKFDEFASSKIKPMTLLVPEKILKSSMANITTVTEYSKNLTLKMLRPLSKKQMAEQFDIAYFAFTKENKDMTFSFPVLLLLGDKDKTLKISHYSKMWSKDKGYPLHIIKNANHMLNTDNFEEVNSEIKIFLDSL